MNSNIWTSNTTVTGNISNLSNLQNMYISTGTTVSFETEEEKRTRRKNLIKSILDGDDYLLQELITELRKEKLKKIKESI
jgi:hypothetical protein